LSKTTHRLYFDDPYQTAFLARVVETDPSALRVILDKTAFYPTSGGQPHDLGAIDGIPVIDVVDADDRIVHVLERPFHGGEAVGGSISWARRHDHMQQHTGQHLLSAVLADLYKMQTVSFHMGPVSSTIDLATPSLSQHQIETAELRANEIVQENRSVSTSFEDAAVVTGLRKPTDRTGIIRVVSIEALDRSACGGTHVRSTGEIGAILLRSVEKIRGNLRLEFLCGRRAILAARTSYNALDRAARSFSARLDEVPDLVAGTLERLKDAEKTRRKLDSELAGYRGRELFDKTNPNERGLRVLERIVPQGPLGDDVRNEANGFTAGSKAVYVAVSEVPSSIMLSASSDAGVDCGKLIKTVLSEYSGRGGGSATMAQGSFTGDATTVCKRVRELLSAV
jgi:alanyl-tRNA synthetase